MGTALLLSRATCPEQEARIGDQTGGRVYFPWRDSELAAIGRTIAADAHSRYLLTYTPTNQKRDGSWREIKLELRSESYSVRARQGYRAPEK